MRTNARSIALAAVLFLPSAAAAQASATATASMNLRLDLPLVLPQLVVVTPGVQVVPDVEHEVFLVDGFYWARHGDGWYRSRSHRGGWVLVPARGVPAKLTSLPPGKYKRWKGEKGHGNDHGKRGKNDKKKH
jgi:hypothetical protein